MINTTQLVDQDWERYLYTDLAYLQALRERQEQALMLELLEPKPRLRVGHVKKRYFTKKPKDHARILHSPQSSSVQLATSSTTRSEPALPF